VNRTPRFRVGHSLLVVLISIGVTPIAAAETRQTPPAPRASAAKRAPRAATKSATKRLYSTQRSVPRKARLARARAAATAREMAETIVPRYKVDASGDLVPDIRAAAAIIYNPETNEVLWEENSQSQRSIASITKVMTAVAFLEADPDLTQPITVVRGDVFRASTTYLRANDQITAEELLHLLLIASDNAAARVLARVSPYGTDGFIQRMNQKAAELGLENTRYADPSGLLSDNVSSAYDMARLIAHASANEKISSIMRLQAYTVQTSNRSIAVHSTNHMLGRQDFDVRAAKTGFISKSGYCFATLLRLPQGGHQVALVVLGARSNAGRFMETQNLFNWISTKASTIFATNAPIATAAP
jgi:serine-type D-Ala-D-Ala endopeptidase (penicillin-binding protein 7)